MISSQVGELTFHECAARDSGATAVLAAAREARTVHMRVTRAKDILDDDSGGCN
jgi:hypothetical protein